MRWKFTLVIVAWAAAAWLTFAHSPRTEHKRIDCSRAEFHPDYTPQMREECRRVRAGARLL